MTFRHSRAGLFVWHGVLLLAALIVLLLVMDRRVGVYDEGIILTGALRMMQGALPHRDFYANYGPGEFGLLAALFRLFHPSVAIERLADSGWRVVTVWMIHVLAHQAGARRTAAALAACGALIWLAAAGQYGYPTFPACALFLAGLATAQYAIKGRSTLALAVAAGGLTGSATWFRYDIGLTGLVMQGAVILAAVYVRPPTGQTSAHAAAKFGIGYAVGATCMLLPMALLYVEGGVLPGLWFDIVSFQSAHYAAARRLPFPDIMTIRNDPETVAIYFPLVVLAAALPILADIKYRWRGVPPISAIALLYAKGCIRVGLGHMLSAIVASFVVLAAFAHVGRRPAIRLIAASAAVLLTLFPLKVCEQRFGDNLRWLMSGAPLPVFLARPDQAQAAAWIDSHTRPADTLFSALPHNDRIFVNDLLLYFLAKRQPATHWYHFDPDLQNSAQIQRNIIIDLQASKPPCIALDAYWDHTSEPNDSAVSSGVMLLDRWIAAHYVTVARFGTIRILQPRPLQ